jgi:uncharacterized protein (TIGR00255 family)
MIRSMTGFGRGEREAGGLLITADVRTVNHRFLDVRIKLPPESTPLESDLRRRIGKHVRRGRVELSISLQRGNGTGDVRVNQSLVRGYLAAARAVQKETGLTGDVPLSMLLQLPGALKVESARPSLSRSECTAVGAAVEDALQALSDMRGREGTVLARDLGRRIVSIRRATAAIRRRASGLSARKAQRLRKKIRDLASGVDVDPARLAQEVAILADRADIEEELVRLDAHLDAIEDLLARGKGSRGKELDFLTQELNRETNTIHSKAGDLSITRAALGIKAEIEKIREQVQNIE